MQSRVFKLLCVCLVGSTAVSACDTTKYTKDAGECAKAGTKCITEKGKDGVCESMQCSKSQLDCTLKAVADADCCDTMKASLDASKDAWDKSMESYKDTLGDCDVKMDMKCGGSSSDASSTKASVGLFATITALMLSKMM